MNKKTLCTLWAALFIVCAVLGFIPRPEGAAGAALTAAALLFFVPPSLLLYESIRRQDREGICLIRNLSGLSLLLTLVLIILNIVSALWPEAAGNFLHIVLTIVSSPMICCGSWVLSLFLWACLLMVSLRYSRK